MGRKKRDKKNKRRRIKESTGTVPENIPGKAVPPEQRDFSHLSGEWRKLYKLITHQLGRR